MRNAQYLRAQAEFCLQAARRISDNKTIENLKVDAARYHAEATEVEAAHRAGLKSDASLERDRPAEPDLRSWYEERAYVRLLRELREGLQASYNNDRAQPLPPRMVDLLKALEDRTLRDTGAPWEAPMPMNRFVHEQNLRHLRAMLARANDEVECRRIVALIEEEEAKWAAEIRYRNSHD